MKIVNPDDVIAQLQPAIEALLEQRKELIEKHLKDLEAIDQKLTILGYEKSEKRGRRPKVASTE